MRFLEVKMFQETWNKGQRWSDENQFGSRQGVYKVYLLYVYQEIPNTQNKITK